MPYHDARTGVQLALTCRALGDENGCRRELAAAIATFDRLGATHDARLAAAHVGPQERGPLTGRERAVLRQIAAGHTNREIAEGLTISRHTVARHVQNIFAKLGVATRAAAVAQGDRAAHRVTPLAGRRGETDHGIDGWMVDLGDAHDAITARNVGP